MRRVYENRDRLLEALVPKEFLMVGGAGTRSRGEFLTSTLRWTERLNAWASLKNFQTNNKKQTTPSVDPGNPKVGFHGEKHSNQTHESTTDPDATLAQGKRQAGEAE